MQEIVHVELGGEKNNYVILTNCVVLCCGALRCLFGLKQVVEQPSYSYVIWNNASEELLTTKLIMTATSRRRRRSGCCTTTALPIQFDDASPIQTHRRLWTFQKPLDCFFLYHNLAFSCNSRGEGSGGAVGVCCRQCCWSCEMVVLKALESKPQGLAFRIYNAGSVVMIFAFWNNQQHNDNQEVDLLVANKFI